MTECSGFFFSLAIILVSHYYKEVSYNACKVKGVHTVHRMCNYKYCWGIWV